MGGKCGLCGLRQPGQRAGSTTYTPNSWLLDTNYSGGLQETHYFDGRLLTAEAFKADQGATKTRLNWLGRAAGAGIIEGLVVRKIGTSATMVGITQGLGVNYAG